MAGYSKTPLAKKLGYKPGFKVLVLGAPDHYWKLFDEIPLDLTVQTRLGKGPYDLIHFFCTQEKEFVQKVMKFRPVLELTGSLWVSWPKGKSTITTDINRDFIRKFILKNVGLVDCKVAAVDEDWSGLKFMVRKVDR